MKTGIFGGTFDPVHNAHLMIAKNAREQFLLDQVLFMPSPNPPHKNTAEITPIFHRCKMIKLALEDQPGFYFSDFELRKTPRRDGNVYTADTLKHYHELFPTEDLFFILGSDSLYSIDSWYQPEAIFALARILVFERADSSGGVLHEKIRLLRTHFNANISIIKGTPCAISSTEARAEANRSGLSGMVPEKVLDYIKAKELYKNSSASRRMTNAEIEEDLKKHLDTHRFEHTMRVAKTAADLSQSLGENPNKAYLAGLLHDCAKCLSGEECFSICSENGLMISEAENRDRSLLHAKAGALIAREKYHITEDDVLNAIRYHTTGRPAMTLLEKIIFTADYIEPGRNRQRHLTLLRQLAYTDIDKTVCTILEDTLEYLKTERNKPVDPQTEYAFEYYNNLIKKRSDNDTDQTET